MEHRGLPIPSFYQAEETKDLNDELARSVKVADFNADQLPFNQLGGRGFELLTYLLKRPGIAVVTTVR